MRLFHRADSMIASLTDILLPFVINYACMQSLSEPVDSHNIGSVEVLL